MIKGKQTLVVPALITPRLAGNAAQATTRAAQVNDGKAIQPIDGYRRVFDDCRRCDCTMLARTAEDEDRYWASQAVALTPADSFEDLAARCARPQRELFRRDEPSNDCGVHICVGSELPRAWAPETQRV